MHLKHACGFLTFMAMQTVQMENTVNVMIDCCSHIQQYCGYHKLRRFRSTTEALKGLVAKILLTV